MKKIINKPEDFIQEMLEGIYIANKPYVTSVAGDHHCLVSKKKTKGKVGLATGGGSGHLPLFLGYVGYGMLDGCSVGDVFQSPSAEQMLAVTERLIRAAAYFIFTEIIMVISLILIWRQKWQILKKISESKALSRRRCCICRPIRTE